MKNIKIFYTKKIIITLLIHTIITLMLPVEISAQMLIFSDDFTNNTPFGWIEVRNRQWLNPNETCINVDKKAEWKIIEGALGIDINGPGCTTEIIPANFKLSTDRFAYEFDWNFKSPATGDHNVIFLWKDPLNWYDFKITNGEIWLQKIVNGRDYWLSPHKGFYDFQENVWHKVKIIKDKENIKLIIDNDEIISTKDQAPYIDGVLTIGLQASVGAIRESHSFFDNIRVYDLNQEENTVFKQTDPKWAEQEYDHAQEWSDSPTIERWGCALTSMTTLLRHYGINKLPPKDANQPDDRLEINPNTLNQWLKSQVDGYLGEGLLNWIAVTRLTHLISQLDNTDKLEYQYLPIANTDQPYQEAISELNDQRWTIAQIPGHFVTVYDKTEDNKDLKIYDPYYEIGLMSQHTQNNKGPKSYRKFTPSQTDLSYLLFAFSSDINVKIFNEDNQDITNQYRYVEQINNTAGNTQTTQVNIIAIPKPETGKFRIQVEANLVKQASLTIYAYDDQANLTDLGQKDLVLGITPIEFEIDYQKQAQSSIMPVSTSFNELLSTTSQLANDQQIPWRIYWWLETYLKSWQSNQDQSLDKAYRELNLKLIDWFKPELDANIWLYLKNQVKNINPSLD